MCRLFGTYSPRLRRRRRFVTILNFVWSGLRTVAYIVNSNLQAWLAENGLLKLSLPLALPSLTAAPRHFWYVKNYGSSNYLIEYFPHVIQALVFLAFSTAYGYVVQFKIFSLSVGFGLFHGLVFLPVVLSLFGGTISKVIIPQSYILSSVFCMPSLELFKEIFAPRSHSHKSNQS